MSTELFDLRGQTALVTGASRGLGEAIAKGLARAGAAVAICGRARPDLERVCADIRAAGGEAEPFELDVLDSAAVASSVTEILDRMKQVDILVNNAGVNARKPVLELSEEDWDLVLNTNLKGYFLVARAVVPQMIARGRGKVVNVASIMGTVVLPELLPYACSKGGVVQMTKVMAVEWAQQGVTVNAIGPTYFETPLTAPLRNDPERNNFIIDRTPMGRWGQPAELVGTTVFLASRASDFVTGQTIYVDGGWTAW
jgi:NAD(P)-dependent dehydrogenase (short-subunit alcohol dehydrogenase family)